MIYTHVWSAAYLSNVRNSTGRNEVFRIKERMRPELKWSVL